MVSYTLFITLNFVAVAIIVWNHWFDKTQLSHTKSSNWFLKLLEIHVRPVYMLKPFYFIPLYLSELILLLVGDKLLELLCAIQRGITVRQLRKIYEYNYILSTKVIGKGSKQAEAVHFIPAVGFIQGIKNVIMFYLGLVKEVDTRSESFKDRSDHKQINMSEIEL